MIDKELIKQEIERLRDIDEETSHLNKESFNSGRWKALTQLKVFIDSLPEEPVSEDWEEDSSFEKILQEIYIKYDKKISIESLLDIARHFAEWGRNHFEDKSEMVSEDLEEEMIRWHKEHFGNKRDWEKTSGEYLTRKSQLALARHFAEWQKKKDLQDFLEKAEMYLKTRVYYNMHPNNITTAIQDFKNYIENEEM